jgi:signal transduction histidine kinase
LKYKQPHGINVGEARDYLNEHGGVRVYDSGFHLPFYGQPDNDWLGIEIDHSHRLSKSKLLPDELHVPGGMEYLPTQSRLLGVVHVNTSGEREAAKRAHEDEVDYLKIEVTRDRLVDNRGFQNLRYIVRYALDFYAMQEVKRGWERAQAKRAVEPVREKFMRVDQVLERHREEIPKPVYMTLRTQVKDAIVASETEAEVMTRQVGLLGALATAGISALGYEHEVGKQFQVLGGVVEHLTKIQTSDRAIRQQLDEIASRLTEWIDRARATRALFSPLMDEENRDVKARFKARQVLDQVKTQMRILTRGVDIDTSGIDDSLRLPEARFTEWSAIFQNVFINAVNAMLDSEKKSIVVSSRIWGRTRALLVQDTGCGVDLSSADKLFEPFVRRLEISPERRALGLGGTGLGLTIVRMIANNLNCRVAFVEPEGEFKTSFQIYWSELK